MKKELLCILGLLCLSGALAAQPATADRHAARGMGCEACYADNDKTRPVRKDACLKCHGSYESMARRTEKVVPNPHFNHYGDRDCTTCHKGHQHSVVSCNACHQFDLKTT